VRVFRKPSNNANGNTRDRQGRLLTCEHDSRRLTRTEHDGSDHGDRRPLDASRSTRRTISCASRRSIWFTDPPFGVSATRGHVPKPNCRPTSIAGSQDGQVAVARRCDRPNGLAFSPDESRLYIIEAPRTRAWSASTTWWTAAPALERPRFLTAEPNGTPDRLSVDVDGKSLDAAGYETGSEASTASTLQFNQRSQA